MKKQQLMALLLVAGNVFAGEEPTATPYRPTISNPAELSAPGWLELEAGWLDNHSGGNRKSVPYLAKLAFNEDWGVMVGGEAWIRDLSGPDCTGSGDTSLTLKHRIPTGDDSQNFGFEAGVKLPTARNGLGSGKSDYTVNGIYSLDFAESWRLDANLGVTRLGGRESGIGRVSSLWALALSTAVNDWTLAGEVSGTHQAGVSDSTQWLAAASYAITPRLVLDGGVSLVHQAQSDDHMLFLGATWLANRLF